MPMHRMPWPDIPYAAWRETSLALHLWLQIVGKYRLAHTPWENHSWHATFYVVARGLGTGTIHADGSTLTVVFDLIDHRFVVETANWGSCRKAVHSLHPVAFVGTASVPTYDLYETTTQTSAVVAAPVEQRRSATYRC